MICRSCIKWSAYTTQSPSNFLIFGCATMKLRFGLEKDFIAGKFLGTAQEKRDGKISDMPTRCEKYIGEEF